MFVFNYIYQFLRLIRTTNLLIIAATFYLMRWFVVYPLIHQLNKIHFNAFEKTETIVTFQFEPQLSGFYFFLLVLATVLIAGAGYVINDYFDVKSDLINKPKRVIVEKHISRKATIIIHICLNFIGVLLGFIVSTKAGIFKFGFIFLMIVGVLFYYSFTYKTQLLIGNLIISLLIGFIPIIVVIFEIPSMNANYNLTLIEYSISFSYVFHWLAIFALFAFLINFIREVIKDLQDVQGDVVISKQTLPIVFGVKTSKIVVISLILFVIGLISLIFIKILPEKVMFTIENMENAKLAWFQKISPYKIGLVYMITFLIIPLMILTIMVGRASSKLQWKRASVFTKVIMILGLFFAFVISFVFNNYQIFYNFN